MHHQGVERRIVRADEHDVHGVDGVKLTHRLDLRRVGRARLVRLKDLDVQQDVVVELDARGHQHDHLAAKGQAAGAAVDAQRDLAALHEALDALLQHGHGARQLRRQRGGRRGQPAAQLAEQKVHALREVLGDGGERHAGSAVAARSERANEQRARQRAHRLCRARDSHRALLRSLRTAAAAGGVYTRHLAGNARLRRVKEPQAPHVALRAHVPGDGVAGRLHDARLRVGLVAHAANELALHSQLHSPLRAFAVDERVGRHQRAQRLDRRHHVLDLRLRLRHLEHVPPGARTRLSRLHEENVERSCIVARGLFLRPEGVERLHLLHGQKFAWRRAPPVTRRPQKNFTSPEKPPLFPPSFFSSFFFPFPSLPFSSFSRPQERSGTWVSKNHSKPTPQKPRFGVTF